MRPFRRSSGFHLIDLIFALALWAALVASAIPALSAIKKRLAVREEARQIRSRLEGLWTRSLHSRERIYVRLRNDGYSAHRGSPGGSQIDAYRVRPEVRLTSTLGDGSLIFHANGVSRPATLTLRGEGHSCEISIGLRGRIKAEC